MITNRMAVGVCVVALVLSLFSCAEGGDPPGARTHEERRLEMVARQIEARGVDDACVLEAMREVPRHRFVPTGLQDRAYQDSPLLIGSGQTISQPYIVGLMTQLIRPEAAMKVLEIGTGSGYQAAILSRCVGKVYSIEIHAELGLDAQALLQDIGYDNVTVRIGDGFDGWPEQAPFDAIVVTAAPDEIPQPLLDQLAVGGRLVIPVGVWSQDLVVVRRTEAGFEREHIAAVRFVPMTGKAERER
jgi:protein-L-isoaspartate(D-aspartate) O-methyltransferase